MPRVLYFLLGLILLTGTASAKHDDWDGDHESYWNRHYDRYRGHDRHDHNKGYYRQGYRPEGYGYVTGYNNGYRSLPPGLQKKVYRTGRIPPGWQKKLHPSSVIYGSPYAYDYPVYPEPRIGTPVYGPANNVLLMFSFGR